jgi:CrcB protein
MIVIAVAVGGAIGSVARYGLSVWSHRLFGGGFPFGTAAANLLGCLILGVVIGIIEERGDLPPATRSFITAGFLAGMTTYSTFIYDASTMARDGETTKALFYFSSSLAVSIALFAAGLAGARWAVR